MPSVLIVEDEEMLRDAFSVILSTLPYESALAADGSIALDLCEKKDYDLILLDLMMPVMDGVKFLEEYRKTVGSAKVIVMSNLSSSKMLDEAKRIGIDRSLLKSDVSPLELIALIHEELSSINSIEK